MDEKNSKEIVDQLKILNQKIEDLIDTIRCK